MTTNSRQFPRDQKDIQVNVVFAGDEYVQKLNAQFRTEDETTDVLSFPSGEEIEEGVYLLGEIIVNLERARRQAEEYGVSEREEVARLVTHGALHLLGYDDGDERSREEMEEAQEKIVKEAQNANLKSQNHNVKP